MSGASFVIDILFEDTGSEVGHATQLARHLQHRWITY
jgi:hypothetical protein